MEKKEYDLSGDLNEQCRDAIKNKDYDGVSKLIEAKADANYIDRSGNSLAHMAALFDTSKIMQLLVENNANLSAKNARNETPADLATATLKIKLEKLIQE